jgi:hypothetical protein
MAEQRYEREIDELLQRMDREQRAPLPFRRRRAAPWAGLGARLGQLVGGQSLVERLMAAAVALLLATVFLGFFAPGLSRIAGVAAVSCFVAALAVSVWAGVQAPHGSRYRRAPSYPAAGGVDWDRLGWRIRRWLGRFRR